MPRLFPVNTKGELQRVEGEEWGYELFRWSLRERGLICLLAWPVLLDIETLEVGYRGLFQWYRMGYGWAIELWFGRRGIAFFWPFMKVMALKDEGLRRDAENRD